MFPDTGVQPGRLFSLQVAPGCLRTGLAHDRMGVGDTVGAVDSGSARGDGPGCMDDDPEEAQQEKGSR